MYHLFLLLLQILDRQKPYFVLSYASSDPIMIIFSCNLVPIWYIVVVEILNICIFCAVLYTLDLEAHFIQN